MPELPEVETIKTAIEKSLLNANITRVKINNNSLRIKIPDDFAKRIVGAKIAALQRRAKYVLFELDNNLTLILHLGMSGKIKIADSLPAPEKHDHVILETDKGFLVYNDPRRFGLWTYAETGKLNQNNLFKNLGPEPWDEKLSARFLKEKFKGKKCAVKQALLDQSLVVGIGNIYASESLFEAGIDPRRAAESLSLKECEKLIEKVRAVLEKAIQAGGSTLRDYQKPDGSLGYFQNQHCVYNKTGQKCPGCTCSLEKTGGIRKIVLGGRSTFYCPIKQK